MASPRAVVTTAAVLLALCACCALGCPDARQALDRHNSYRARHGSSALSWDDGLERSARAWASQLAANGCGLTHSPKSSRPGAGENLHMSWGSVGEPSCLKATDNWYREVAQYRFTSRPYTDNKATFLKIGHFTQLVWRSTTRLGCAGVMGTHSSGSRCYVVACQYGPPGNYVGDDQYLANVKPGNCGDNCGGSDDSCSDLLSWCPSWASKGYCGPQWSWQGKSVRNVQCRKSCGTCSGRRSMRSSEEVPTSEGPAPVEVPGVIHEVDGEPLSLNATTAAPGTRRSLRL